MESRPDLPTAPSLPELRARVEREEAELKESLRQLGEILEHATDWKKVVEEHPLECALGAATLGFLVGLKPSIVTDTGATGVRAVMGLGIEALLGGPGSRRP